jgi:hypothetical protein
MTIGYNREQDAKRFLITDSGVCVVPKEMPLGSSG